MCNNNSNPLSNYLSLPWVSKIGLVQVLNQSGYTIKNEDEFSHDELVIMLIEDREIKPSIISSIFTVLVSSPQHGSISVGEVDMSLGMTTQKKAAKQLGWFTMKIANKKADLNKEDNVDKDIADEIEQENVPKK